MGLSEFEIRCLKPMPRYSSSIHLSSMRIAVNNLSCDNREPWWDLSRISCKCKTSLLWTTATHAECTYRITLALKCSLHTYSIPFHHCHRDNLCFHHNVCPLRCKPCLPHSGCDYLDNSHSWFHLRCPCSPPHHHKLVLTNHVLAVPSHSLSQKW